MLKTMLLTLVLVAASVCLLGIGIMIKGRFPSMHVGANPAMRKRGIGCVQSQDYAARKGNRHAIKEKE